MKEGRTEQVEVQDWALGLSDRKYLGRWRAHVFCANSSFPHNSLSLSRPCPILSAVAHSCCLSGTDFCWRICPAAIQVWAWHIRPDLFSSEVVTSKLKTWKNRERADIYIYIYIYIYTHTWPSRVFFCLRVCPSQYCSVGYLDSFLHAPDLKNEVYIFPKFPVSI